MFEIFDITLGTVDSSYNDTIYNDNLSIAIPLLRTDFFVLKYRPILL